MASGLQRELKAAASVIRNAKALVFTSGAGMGVDSGLPDFRGPEGFWRAYPPLRERGLRLESMSTPHWFDSDPRFAWGFFGHRYNLYSQAKAHKGYHIILDWAKSMEHGYFAFTSNVDGHTQKAGFDENCIVECHGSIHFLQCVDTSLDDCIWPMPNDATFEVDDSLRLQSELPHGPPGKAHMARPNILMFGDWSWLSRRTDAQEQRYEAFCTKYLRTGAPFVVIEVGAGLAVPTVRHESESLVRNSAGKGTLIRINPSEPDVPKGHIGLPMNGLEALQQIQDLYESQ